MTKISNKKTAMVSRPETNVLDVGQLHLDQSTVLLYEHGQGIVYVEILKDKATARFIHNHILYEWTMEEVKSLRSVVLVLAIEIKDITRTTN